MFTFRLLLNVAAGIAACAMVFAGTSASAQSVQPMRFDLQPSGARSQQTLTIENNRAYPITVEIFAEAISTGEDGTEILSPADDDFLIFPPQALIEAGKSQSVRVKYIGEPGLDVSQTYRVHVNQLAVDLSGEQRTGVRVALNFATLASVVPAGAKPFLVVDNVEPTADGQLKVSLRNEGKAYERLVATEWTLSSGKTAKTFADDALLEWLAGVSSLVLPGETRDFVIPVPEGFDAASTTVEVASR